MYNIVLYIYIVLHSYIIYLCTFPFVSDQFLRIPMDPPTVGSSKRQPSASRGECPAGPFGVRTLSALGMRLGRHTKKRWPYDIHTIQYDSGILFP